MFKNYIFCSETGEFSSEQVSHLTEMFNRFLAPNSEVMCMDQFKKMMGGGSSVSRAKIQEAEGFFYFYSTGT